MKLRSLPRIDYSVLNDRGEKVIKVDERVKMGDKVVEELKVVEDIRHSLETYQGVEKFETIQEIEEGVAVINELGKQYRHLHVELRAELGDEEYGQKYPHYGTNVQVLKQFSKVARDRMKILREEASKVDDKTYEQFSKLRVSRDVLDMKIKQVEDSIDLKNVDDISDINEYISKMEAFLNEYFDMSGRYKLCLGDEYDGELFEDDLKYLSDCIKFAKNVRKNVSQATKTKEDQISLEKLKTGQVLKGENLFSEITKRLEILELKYDQDLCSW